MITAKKRGKFEIYGDILTAIGEEASWEGGARLTHVQAQSNVAYDRFRKDLATLEGRGLVKLNHMDGEGISIVLTDAGKGYLDHYRSVRKFMETYGL